MSASGRPGPSERHQWPTLCSRMIQRFSQMKFIFFLLAHDDILKLCECDRLTREAPGKNFLCMSHMRAQDTHIETVSLPFCTSDWSGFTAFIVTSVQTGSSACDLATVHFLHWQQETDTHPAVWDATSCLTLMRSDLVNNQHKEKNSVCAFSLSLLFCTSLTAHAGHSLSVSAIQQCIARPPVAELCHHCSSSPSSKAESYLENYSFALDPLTETRPKMRGGRGAAETGMSVVCPWGPGSQPESGTGTTWSPSADWFNVYLENLNTKIIGNFVVVVLHLKCNGIFIITI